jgi:hypothetical protein
MKSKILSVWVALVLVLGMSMMLAVPVSAGAPPATDGSGTCTVTPTSVIAGSTGNTLTFLFTAAGNMDGGAITIMVPAYWSVPQATSGTEGYTTATSSGGTIGTLTFYGQTVTVPITTLPGAGTITVVYGNGGVTSGGHAQTSTGTATFTTESKVSASGTLTAIVASPQVTVNAATQPVVNLGAAANYVILAKSGISTTGTTSIVGDIGVGSISS